MAINIFTRNLVSSTYSTFLDTGVREILHRAVTRYCSTHPMCVQVMDGNKFMWEISNNTITRMVHYTVRTTHRFEMRPLTHRCTDGANSVGNYTMWAKNLCLWFLSRVVA